MNTFKIVTLSIMLSLALVACNKNKGDGDSNGTTAGTSSTVIVPLTTVTTPTTQPGALPADTSIGTPANPAGVPSENQAMPLPTGANGELINSGTDTINNGGGTITKPAPSSTDQGDQD